ncbi:MAG: trigger factor, partial [Bifidobacteriaceae bacterium]|nr:trigger factor [Bifidobacteriaceae bacterium]
SAVESLEPTKVKLTVEVDWDDLKPVLDKAYKEIRGQISVPGFRPGKVPNRIIDQRVGRGAVIEQAINDALGGWYRAALDEHKVRPMAQAKVDLSRRPDPVAAEPDFEFTATVEIRPEVVLPDLSTVKVVVKPAAVTDEEVESLLDELRGRFASLKTVDRPAAEGDFVTLDLKAEIDGEEIDSVSGISYQIGAGNMLQGLDEALDGLSAGEETTFNSALAGGERAGEQALVTVSLEAVKERELPPADDDFAELASPFDTIEELREDFRVTAAKQAERRQVVEAQDKLIDHLLETLDFPAPPGVVQADAEARLARDGKPADDEAALAERKADATKAVRTQLLMDALVERLKVEASRQELVGFMLNLSGSYGIDPQSFIMAADKSGELPHFQAELLRNKAAVEALRRAAVEDEDGQAIDIKARLTSPDAKLGDALAAVDGDGAEDEAVAVDALIEQVDIDLAALAEADEEA